MLSRKHIKHGSFGCIGVVWYIFKDLLAQFWTQVDWFVIWPEKKRQVLIFVFCHGDTPVSTCTRKLCWSPIILLASVSLAPPCLMAVMANLSSTLLCSFSALSCCLICSTQTHWCTIDREIFMLKIICIKDFRVDKFSRRSLFNPQNIFNGWQLHNGRASGVFLAFSLLPGIRRANNRWL